MRHKMSIIRIAAGLVLALGTVVVSAPPSSSAELELTLALSEGVVTVEDTVVPLPDGDPAGEGTTVLLGTGDDETGALSGALTIPRIVTEQPNPLNPATTFEVYMDFTQVGSGEGAIDPDTMVGSFAVTLRLRLSSPDPTIGPIIGDDCVIDPISLEMTVTLDVDAAPPALDFEDSGFLVPGATGCGDNGSLNQLVNDTLGIDGDGTTDTTAVMNFQVVNELPAPAAPSAPPAATPTAPAMPQSPEAQAVVARPNLTG